MSHGIPTVGPKGIQFRSRIEAQWAYVFEALKWKWEYEPYDLPGYIPDFIVTFPNKQVLVEVKGAVNIWETTEHVHKIIDSGWEGSYVIVGANYDVCPEGRLIIGTHESGPVYLLDDYTFHWTNQEQQPSFTKTETFEKIWVCAKNKVQWKPGKYKSKFVKK